MADATAGEEAGRLTTHVLDTARGLPAAGLGVSLYAIEGGRSHERRMVKRDRTNADGRCAAPLLVGADFRFGVYELVFEAGRYFDDTGYGLSEPKFLDEVVLRFGLSEARHYHVPLLLSPFGYSTYRGS